MASASMRVRSSGSAEVRWEEPDIVEVVFSGHVTGVVTEKAIAALATFTVRRVPTFCLINCTDAAGYDTSVRTPGVALLRRLRASGVVLGACVAPSAAVRMIGAAVAFVSGLHIDFVETRPLALQKFAAERARSLSASA